MIELVVFFGGIARGFAVRIDLLVVAGPHTGKNFSFDGHDSFIVGRADCAHLQLTGKDKFFSRVHFVVEVNPPQCRIT